MFHTEHIETKGAHCTVYTELKDEKRHRHPVVAIAEKHLQVNPEQLETSLNKLDQRMCGRWPLAHLSW